MRFFFQNNKYLKLATLFSFIYCLFFNFIFQENVTVAKYFEYDVNDIINPVFLTYIFNAQSILIGLAILLKKIGIDQLYLHFFFNFLLTLTSFLSIYYLAKIFSNSNIYCFLIPIIFLPFNFVNTRWYGIDYPSGFFNFGQFGLYLTILSLSLFILEHHKNSIFVYILCIFTNPVWGIINSAIIGTLIVLKFKNIKINTLVNNKTIIFFVSILILFLFTLYEINSAKNFVLTNNEVINNIAKNESSPHQFFTKKNSVNSVYNETHNFRLNFEDNSFIFDIFRFICFDLLIVFIFIKYKSNNLKENILIKIIFINIIISYLLVLIQFFNFQHPTINYLFERLSLNRSLNINNIMILVFIISKILLNERNLKIFHFSIILFSVSNFLINIFFFNYTFEEYIPFYGKYISYYDLIVYSLVITFILGNYLKQKINYKNNKMINILLILSFLPFFSNKFLNNYFDVTNAFKDSEKIIDYKNNIFLTGGVIGFVNPSSFLENKNIFMFNPQFFFFSYSQDLKKIFCSNENKNFAMQYDYFDYLDQTCFKNKTKKEWLKYSKQLNFEYIITRSNLDLDLELLSNNSKYKIYKIKQ